MNPWKDARVPLVASLVTTVDREGRPNASPKTWWTPVSYEPPMLAISLKPWSDTFHNVQETGIFALHLPMGRSQDESTKVLHTAKPLPRGENELEDVGLGWEWYQYGQMERALPLVDNMPYFVCWVIEYWQTGDHMMVLSQVGLSGGWPIQDGVQDVLLHRGKNRFVSLGKEWAATPYVYAKEQSGREEASEDRDASKDAPVG